MKIKDAIKNFKELKDEALQLREGMDYSKAILIADFCDRAVFQFGQDEMKYGSGEEVTSMPQPVTLADFSIEQQEKFLRQKKGYKPLVFDDGRMPSSEAEFSQVGSINSDDLLHAKQKIAEILDEDWPSNLFTPMEIYSLSFKDEKEIVDIVDAAVTKDIIQNTKLRQMENNEPIEDLIKSFMEMKPWQNDINDSDFNAWVLMDCKAIEEFCSIYTKYLREDREALEHVIFDLKDNNLPISSRENVKLFSYGAGLQAYFNSEMEKRTSLQKMLQGDYGLFVRPIVSFLQKAGMKDKNIIETFSEMKKMAKILVGQRDKLPAP